jgi:cobalt/nickel transport system permease protein
MAVAAIPAVAVSVKKVREDIPREKLPMLGIGAAFSFLLMMFNLPLPGGTTGHAVGGTLIALLLGPYAACLSVSTALVIQALLFGDGGILALGANIFNIAFVLPFAGYFVYTIVKRAFGAKRGEFIGVVAGSWVGINAAALITAVEFGVQPLLFRDELGQALYCPYPLSVSIPAMMIPHMLVAGVVEAVFTVSIFEFIKRASPGDIYEGGEKRTPRVFALLAALIALVPLGLLAAGTAWGEWGADEIAGVVSNGGALGYTPSGMANGFSFSALMPDYSIAALPEVLGYILSALFGAAILVIAFRLIAGAVRKKT